MTKEYSPFTPGIPVPVEFFIGREQEIGKIVSSVRRCVAMKTIERIFVVGERGIGKSSICNYALRVCEREEILGLHILLGGADSLEELAKRIMEAIVNASDSKPWYEKAKEFFGNRVKQLGLFGFRVELNLTAQDLSAIVNDVDSILKDLIAKTGHKGVLLILDDLNGLAKLDKFADWLKSFVDKVSVNKSLPITLILSGLAERRTMLINNQPSLDRVFDIIKIEKFSPKEVEDFYTRTFYRVKVKVKPEAFHILSHYSGGYPAFMHEIGDATFNADSNSEIDAKDAMTGVINATEIIGRKYIETNILDEIRSDKYKKILKMLTEKPFEYRFFRKQMNENLTNEEKKVTDNFLRKMEKLGVIKKITDAPVGTYQFTNQIYYLFFHLHLNLKGNSR
ncbi:MAG: ATP-binding protein [Blastocatellia bacterium]|nr:ATP-binding protein [Blastocatellia bacterium]